MTGRTIVITGASDGIGAAGARELTRRGEEVVVVGRSAEKTRAVAAEIGAEYHLVDFTSLDQVAELADKLAANHARIDVLVNNAGAVNDRREITPDGFEKTFQVNHLGPFLLTTRLLDRLTESRASVVTTASAAHVQGRLDLSNLDFGRGYSAMRAYGTSKLANIAFSAELHRRHHEAGVSAASFHPGVVASSFGSQSNPLLRMVYSWPFNKLMSTNEQGADTLVWLATTEPGLTWTSGLYYARRKPGHLHGQATDAELARQLWDRSAELVAPWSAR